MKENRDVWESIYSDNMSYLNYPDSDLISLFFEIKSIIPSNKRCLDFGCGSGNNSEFLSEYFKELFAVDISVSAINLTRKRLNKIDKKYNLLFDTEINTSFKEVDFILAWQSLYYNSKESFIEAFKKLISCLKPNGIIIFSLLHMEDVKIKNSTKLNNTDYRINSSISTQENCIVFAISSYAELVELLKGFQIDIVDYGRFCRYSNETYGINEYYVIGKKNE